MLGCVDGIAPALTASYRIQALQRQHASLKLCNSTPAGSSIDSLKLRGVAHGDRRHAVTPQQAACTACLIQLQRPTTRHQSQLRRTPHLTGAFPMEARGAAASAVTRRRVAVDLHALRLTRKTQHLLPQAHLTGLGALLSTAC